MTTRDSLRTCAASARRSADDPSPMRALRFTPLSPRAAYAVAAGRRVPGSWAAGRGSPLRLVEVDPPQLPDPSWVRIAVSLAGICGSDLKILHVRGMEPVTFVSTDWRQPIIPGHEVVGTVVEAAEGLGVAEGDRVVAEPLISCTDRGFEPCRQCRAGVPWRCERGGDAGRLPAGQGFGFNAGYGGGWSEQLVAPAVRCVRVPEGLDDADAVLAEPLSVAVHAVRRVLPQPGMRALVVGPGTIGLATLIALRALAPEVAVTVAALGHGADDLCLQLGADSLLHGTRAALLEGARALTGGTLSRPPVGPPVMTGGGFDVVYDCVGSFQTIDDALRMLRPGGDLVMLATAGRQRMDWSLVWLRELTVTGCVCYGDGADGRREMALAVDLLSDVRPGRLVTHRFPLEAATAALTTAAQGPAVGAIKVAFQP